MHHPLETSAAAAFDLLRGFEGRMEAASGSHIVPGVWLAADTGEGRIEAEASAVPGALLRLDVRVLQPGRWLTLNIPLGLAGLAAGDRLGLVAELAADVALQIGVGIRSGHDDGPVDMPFADLLAAGPAPRAAIALLEVEASMTRPDPPAWRNLMLHLPPRDQRLTLHDMRLFVQARPDPAPTPAEAAIGV